MALEKTFRSAFDNDARYFALWGVAMFALLFAGLAAFAVSLIDVARLGEISENTRHLLALFKGPFVIGLVTTTLASAFEFLRRVYRVRRFLVDRGGIRFANWPETLVAFVFPIANFFVPWNRLDVIRETLRTYVTTRKFAVSQAPEKKARTLGILWGMTSIVSVGGIQIEDAAWMSFMLSVNVVMSLVWLASFVLAARWLSELMADFEKLGV